MSTAKRRKLDQETASNGSNSRGGGGTGRSRGGGGGGAGGGAKGNGSSNAGGSGGNGGGSRKDSSNNTNAASSSNGAVNATGNGPNGSGEGSVGPVLSLSTLPVAALSRYALHYGLVPPEPLTPAQATYPTPALPFELTLANSSFATTRKRSTIIPDSRFIRKAGTSAETLLNSGIIGIREGSQAPSSFSRAASTERQTKAPVRGGTPHLGGGGAGGGLAPAVTALQVQKRLNSVQPSSSAAENRPGGRGGGGVPGTSSDQTGAGLGQNQNSALASSSLRNDKDSEWMEPGDPEAEELRGMSAFDGGEEQFKERLGTLAKAHWDKITTVKEGETIINFAYAVRMRSKILKSVPPT